MACSPYSRGSNSTSPSSHNSPGPYVKSEPQLHGMHMGGPRLVILEEPQERFRFRYESELGGTHGQLAGRSGADRRSFPTVKLEGFHQRATIRCELFTVEEPGSNLQPVPHVHTLQGRNCSSGIAEMRVDQENDFTASFQGLGIIHTAKKQMVDKITNRKLNEKKMVMERQLQGKLWNPSETDKLEAREQANRESQRINMNRVSLRFRALYQNPQTMRQEDICPPIFSGPIYNGKSAQTGELKIVQLSETYSPCTGNKEIWLLVERVRKNDIKVLFYEEDDSQQVIWQDYGRVIKCHHQYAIILQTPPYKDNDLRHPRRVSIQLERPSDGCVSEPKNFQYTERDQRTTKRTMVAYQDPAGHKRFALNSETGTTPIEMPSQEQFREYLRQMPPDYPVFQSFTQRQRQQQQQQQQQPASPPQLASQYYPPQPPPFSPAAAAAAAPPHVSPHHPQPSPQHPQPSPQQPSPAASSYYQQPSPYSPQSVASASPQMAQEQMYGSPQHQPYGQQGVMMTQDPMLAGGRAGVSVDEVLSENIPLTVPQTTAAPSPGVSTYGGHQVYGQYLHLQGLHEPTMLNVPGDQAFQGQPMGEMLTATEIDNLVAMLPSGALEDGCVQAPPPSHQAPRGVMTRGVGTTADSAPPADQLADSMGRMSISRETQQGQQGAEGGQPAPLLDLSRPEVKLAMNSANFLYLFAATEDVSILLEHLKCLVGMENYDGDNVLHVAAFFARPEAMARLLKAISGMPAETREAMINSPNANRQTPLHLAVLANSAECARLLLAAGAQSHLVDRSGNTALHLAAEAGAEEVLKELLKTMKERGETHSLLQQTNYHGFNPLHVAVLAGQRQAVLALCEAGADVNAGDDTEGRTGLHLAVERRDQDMCRLLLGSQLNAAVDSLTFGDVTPLHAACRVGDRHLAALLVAAGADPHLRSVERQPPAGSGTESADDEPEEAETDESGERLDAFMYAEMAGDSTLEQILRGRVRLPSPEPEQVQEQTAAPAPAPAPAPALAAAAAAAPAPAPAAAAAPMAEAAGGKKGDMDSGMDSGLGITQELTSQSDMTSQTDVKTCGDGEEKDCLPAAAAAQLAALLEKSADTWQTLAVHLELDVTSLEQHGSPTAAILRCVAKYENLSLKYLAQVLGSLGHTEAQQIVQRHAPQ